MNNTAEIKIAAKSSMRSGFTLIEILVAVAIIGILGTVAVVNIPKMLEGAKKSAAKDAVNNIRSALVSYNLEHKKYPTDLKQLVEGDDPTLDGGEDALLDPWDNAYKMEKKGKNYVVISAGPDGEFGNDDDIRSDKKGDSSK